MHKNDEAQLEQWYNDLTKKLATSNARSNTRFVADVMDAIKLIGDTLDIWQRLPIIDWQAIKRKR
jgi:hypothetical protein